MMETLLICGIGALAGRMVRQVMPQRCYSSFDDFLWGVLGALFGEALMDLAGLSDTLAVPFAALLGAIMVLWATGIFVDKDGVPTVVRPARIFSERRIRPRVSRRPLAREQSASLPLILAERVAGSTTNAITRRRQVGNSAKDSWVSEESIAVIEAEENHERGV